MNLTIDRDLMDQVPPIEGMTILKRWKTEGRVELFEADPPPERRKPVSVVAWTPNGYQTRVKAHSKSASRKTSFAKLAPVVFPMRDVTRLNMQEVNDVAHIAHHSQSGNAIFVTENRNFLDRGKRERLAAAQIIALTPNEAVIALERSEGWKK